MPHKLHTVEPFREAQTRMQLHKPAIFPRFLCESVPFAGLFSSVLWSHSGHDLKLPSSVECSKRTLIFRLKHLRRLLHRIPRSPNPINITLLRLVDRACASSSAHAGYKDTRGVATAVVFVPSATSSLQTSEANAEVLRQPPIAFTEHHELLRTVSCRVRSGRSAALPVVSPLYRLQTYW